MNTLTKEIFVFKRELWQSLKEKTAEHNCRQQNLKLSAVKIVLNTDIQELDTSLESF